VILYFVVKCWCVRLVHSNLELNGTQLVYDFFLTGDFVALIGVIKNSKVR
jgi:hypothetical protein